METTRAVLAAANLTPQSLDEVLLVGGQSRAPLVRRKLEAWLGRPARDEFDPQDAVARGAAILGHSILREAEGKTGARVSDILTLPVGVGLRGGGLLRVLERQTRLPVNKSLPFPMKAGEALSLSVFQGEGARAEDIEPEFAAVSPDGNYALVTLQEQSAVAAVLLEPLRGAGDDAETPEARGERLLAGVVLLPHGVRDRKGRVRGSHPDGLAVSRDGALAANLVQEGSHMGEFVKAARVSEIALGTCRLVVLKGKEIALFNVDGEFFALDNLCTHEEGPLAEGEVEGYEVTCPWHGAKFDIRTGEVLQDPAYDAVARHNVRVTGADIEVEI